MFKFTFHFGSNTVTNPFTAQVDERERIQQSIALQNIQRKLPAPPRCPSPQPGITDDVPRSRKRRWAPTSNPASEAISQPTHTNGWIDTPAKYLGQALLWRSDDAGADLPPPKRRKTLADSIINTAFSAALIGTAVGMTAYRMWRDRGKPSKEPLHVDAPPPYEREEWIDDAPQDQPALRSPRLHRKPRPAMRRVPRHRRPLIAISPTTPSARVHSPSRLGSVKREEPGVDQGEFDNQIDWMSNKICELIEEGQKALGKEIVIQTDNPNDEAGAIDDGMDGWEEEQGPSTTKPISRLPRQRSAKSLSLDTFQFPLPPHGHVARASESKMTTVSHNTQSQHAADDHYSEASIVLGPPYIRVANGNRQAGTSLHKGSRVLHETQGASSGLRSKGDAVSRAYNIH